MTNIEHALALIHGAAGKKIIFSAHALTEMNAEDEIVTASEVRHVLFCGEIIENYQHDRRGHSFLLSGWTDMERPLHVVCAPKDEYLAIITVYVPSVVKWEQGFKVRKRK
jgi:hypothetical protein